MDQEQLKSKVQRLCTTTNDLHKTVLECREDLIQFNSKFQVAQRYMHFGIRGTYTMLKHSMNTLFERLESNFHSLVEVNEMFPDTGIVLCDVNNKTETVIDLTIDLVDHVDQPDKEENVPVMEDKHVNDVVDKKKSPEKTAFEFDMLEEKDFLAVGDTLHVVSDVVISQEEPVSKKRKAEDEEQER